MTVVTTEQSSVGAAAPERLALAGIIRNQGIQPLYQPIVDLDTEQTVGWEALARGPRGSGLEFPDQLFGAGRSFGQTAQLDHCCQGAAIHGALRAELGTAQELFINVEPDAIGHPIPSFLERAQSAA